MSARSGTTREPPPRLVVVHCPDWPVVAAGAAPTEPVAVLHANRVVARTPAAASDGVRQGHRRREAQRICPSLRIIDHDPARDGREFEAAIRSVATMVPRLETTEPGSMAFLARGPSRYFGGEEPMAVGVGQRILEAVPAFTTGAGGTNSNRLGIGIGIGIGDGRFTAGVAARHSARLACNEPPHVRPFLVAPGAAATRSYLAPLPVAFLRDVAGVSAEFVDLLHRLGLHDLGQLAALPAPDVLARFGRPGAFAHRIAAGGDDRPPGSMAPPAGMLVTRSFEDPVHLLDPLVFTAKQLAEELHALLIGNGRVCTRLAVLAETEHGERSEHLWYRPTGLSVTAIIERVRWQLDGWIQQPGGLSGGIVLLRLTPDEVRSDDGDQLGFWGGRSEADEWATRAVARVAGLVGEQRVFVPAWHGGRQPGDTYQWVSVDRADVSESADRLRVTDVPWPGHLPAPSPATVLPDAVPAEVLDDAGEMVRVDGRGGLSAPPARVSVQGRTARAVTAWAGPWPVDERWWDDQQRRRMARFQITTDDGTALLAIVEHQQWWIAAVY
ncbi:MAG: DNA polymerase Y family protein [Ilumatobacteraceae bacterium]